MTREQLAADLGDCSPSTINKWERNINPVPEWVAEKMLNSVRISFPIDELHELLDLARSEDLSFEDLLSEAIRELVKARRSRSKPQPLTVNAGPANDALSPSNITPLHSGAIAADAAADNSDLQAPRKVVYPSGGRKKGA